MHPAASIVLFSVAAGAGYGLLFLLGLGVPLGLVPPEPLLGLIGVGLALALISVGLIASMFHLGHPERAWRALTQWRSSWLSREGVMAVLTFVPATLFGLGWVGLGRADGWWAVCGVLAAAGAALTVVCTGMIYASLKPVRQWNHPLVVPVFLGFALASGALWLTVVLRLGGLDAAWPTQVSLVLLATAWGLKAAAWHALDRAPVRHGIGAATGLGRFGPVRALDPPHTEENYLLREMGFRIARKHRRKLRRAALVLGLVAPAALLLAVFRFGSWPATLAVLCAAASCSLGVVIERWLFFAEARHTVTLYYGERAL